MPSKYNATIPTSKDILNPENPDLSFETIDIVEALDGETVQKSPHHHQSATARSREPESGDLWYDVGTRCGKICLLYTTRNKLHTMCRDSIA